MKNTATPCGRGDAGRRSHAVPAPCGGRAGARRRFRSRRRAEHGSRIRRELPKLTIPATDPYDKLTPEQMRRSARCSRISPT
jgi:hypothetical protein